MMFSTVCRSRTRVLFSPGCCSFLFRRACFTSTVEGHPFPDKAQEDCEAHFKYLRNSHNGAEVFLLGTCHASADSANSVKEMIRVIKPSAVALELCEGRARHLRSEGQVKVLSPTDFLKLPGSLGQKAFSHSIRSLQELLKLFGINYAEEFRVALEEGDKIGANLHYIDRNIDVTLQEVKKNLSFLEITNFIMGLPQHSSQYPALFESASEIAKMRSIEDLMRNKKILGEIFQLLEDHFPGAMKAMLHDRNEVMVKQLRVMEGKVVAVVGLAHIAGMETLWREAEP